MRSTRRHRFAVLAAAVGSLLALSVPTPGGADPSSVGNLRQQNANLEERSHSALVELYSLESQLREQEARVDALRAEVDAVAAERASVRHRLGFVRRAVHITERNLGQRLVRIYEEGEPDALAVLLGAESLRDAVTNLDHLDSIAGQDKYMLRQARRARASLNRLTASLAAREERLASLEQEASAAAGELQAARAERQSYLADLANQRQMNNQ